MAVNVRAEVERLGVCWSSFCDVVVSAKAALTPEWTDEEMLYHLKESAEYVREVRRRLACPRLPDHIVLRSLINRRKRKDAA